MGIPGFQDPKINGATYCTIFQAIFWRYIPLALTWPLTAEEKKDAE